MPQTTQRRRHSSPRATHKPKPNISRPRRTSTAKQGRFSRGWSFRTEPEPTGIKKVMGTVTGSTTGSKKGRAAAAGGLALIAGSLAALRKRQSDRDVSAPGPITPNPVDTPDTGQPAPRTS